jgi:large subunit ribosomal protein L4
MNTKLYSSDGSEAGSFDLPASVFEVSWNADLVHNVVIAMQANARAGTADTKGRGDVRGGGKKPWKQKGTGRARHGSSRSPIWAGGGVAHGPKAEKDYTTKINRKVKAKALATVFSKKFADTEMIFVNSLNLAETKTAIAKTIIKALATGTGHTDLATKRKNAAVVVLPTRDESVEMSFRNFGNIEVMQAKDINPVDLLTYKYVIVADPAATISIFEKRVASVTSTTNVK